MKVLNTEDIQFRLGAPEKVSPNIQKVSVLGSGKNEEEVWSFLKARQKYKVYVCGMKEGYVAESVQSLIGLAGVVHEVKRVYPSMCG